MAFDKSTWDQLKNTTASRLIQALLADNWEGDVIRRAPRAFVKNDGSGKRIVIHFHSQKTQSLPRYLPQVRYMSRTLVGIGDGWADERRGSCRK